MGIFGESDGCEEMVLGGTLAMECKLTLPSNLPPFAYFLKWLEISTRVFGPQLHPSDDSSIIQDHFDIASSGKRCRAPVKYGQPDQLVRTSMRPTWIFLLTKASLNISRFLDRHGTS